MMRVHTQILKYAIIMTQVIQSFFLVLRNTKTAEFYRETAYPVTDEIVVGTTSTLFLPLGIHVRLDANIRLHTPISWFLCCNTNFQCDLDALIFFASYPFELRSKKMSNRHIILCFLTAF